MSASVPLIALSLTVSDMSASLVFYRRLGVMIPNEAIFSLDGAGHHVALEMPGGFAFELDSSAMTRSYFPTWSPGAGGISFLFSVATRDRVDELYATR